MLYTFEVFPPKPTSPVERVTGCFSALASLQPDFISVTYGAGGGLNGGAITCALAERLKNEFGVRPVAHLPCIGYTREEIIRTADALASRGIRDVLALRGDRTDDRPQEGDFRYAADLIAFLREHWGFHILAACYPETHPEAASPAADIRHLREKVDAGAEHLISQLFFDNTLFYRFLERCDIAGISVPIEAGIMPVVNAKQIRRMVGLCGASLPRKFAAVLARFEDDPKSLRDAGIAYAIDQIVDLAAHGVDGVHLYTMNDPEVARRITDATRSLVQVSA